MAERKQSSAHEDRKQTTVSKRQDLADVEEVRLREALNDFRGALSGTQFTRPSPHSFITIQQNLGNKAVQRMVEDLRKEQTRTITGHPSGPISAPGTIQRAKFSEDEPYAVKGLSSGEASSEYSGKVPQGGSGPVTIGHTPQGSAGPVVIGGDSEAGTDPGGWGGLMKGVSSFGSSMMDFGSNIFDMMGSALGFGQEPVKGPVPAGPMMPPMPFGGGASGPKGAVYSGPQGKMPAYGMGSPSVLKMPPPPAPFFPTPYPASAAGPEAAGFKGIAGPPSPLMPGPYHDTGAGHSILDVKGMGSQQPGTPSMPPGMQVNPAQEKVIVMG